MPPGRLCNTIIKTRTDNASEKLCSLPHLLAHILSHLSQSRLVCNQSSSFVQSSIIVTTQLSTQDMSSDFDDTASAEGTSLSDMEAKSLSSLLRLQLRSSSILKISLQLAHHLPKNHCHQNPQYGVVDSRTSTVSLESSPLLH